MTQRQKYLASYVASLAVLAVFLVCGLYAVPSADDYFYANLTRDYGLVQAQVRHYVEWSGRYAATLLISLFSLTDYSSYWTVAWLCILSVLLSFHVFVDTLSRRVRLPFSTWVISLSFMALYLSLWTAGFGHGVAVINEGFFWASGAITYAGSLALYLLLFGLLLDGGREEAEKFSTARLLASLLLLTMLIGLNETAMFLVNLTVLPLLFYRRGWYGGGKVALLAATIILCSAVVILAPGNEVRMQTSDGGSVLSALGVCVEKVVQIFFFYLINPLIWLYVVIFRDEIGAIIAGLQAHIEKKYLYWGGFLLAYLMYFPVAYSLNSGAPDRLVAVIGFFALPFSIFYIWEIYGYMLGKGVARNTIALWSVLLFAAGGYYCAEPLRIAIFTLYDGHQYRQMHLARAKKVKKASSAGAKSFAVESIPRNELLLFEDLKSEGTNPGYAKFYGLNSVTLIK